MSSLQYNSLDEMQATSGMILAPQPSYNQPSQEAFGTYSDNGLPADLTQTQQYYERSAILQDPAISFSGPLATMPVYENHAPAFVGQSQHISAAPQSLFMGPPTQTRKKKAPTLHREAWEPFKDHIRKLYVDKNMSVKRVQQTMEAEYGFKAEPRQFRSQISKWKMDKKVKLREMKAIVRKRQWRKLVESEKKDLAFYLRGELVLPQKIIRWMKEKGIPFDRLYQPHNETAATPSDLGCHTVSARETPASNPISSATTPVRLQDSFSPSVHSPQLLSAGFPTPSSFIRMLNGSSPSFSHTWLEQTVPDLCPTRSDPERSVVLSSQHRYKQDEEELLQSQIYKLDSLTVDSVYVSSALTELAGQLVQILILQEKFKDAEEVARKLVESQKSWKTDENDIIAGLSLLSTVFTCQGLYTKAEEMYRRELRERDMSHPKEYSKGGPSFFGFQLVLVGKYQKARSLLHKKLRSLRMLLGEEKTSALNYVRNPEAYMKEAKRYTDAEATLRTVVWWTMNILWAEHPVTLSRHNEFAEGLDDSGILRLSTTMFRRVLEVSENTFGADSPPVMSVARRLGTSLANMSIGGDIGLDEEAESNLRRAAKGYAKNLGPKHPWTLYAVHVYKEFLNWLGKSEEQKAIERAKNIAEREARVGEREARVVELEEDEEEQEATEV